MRTGNRRSEKQKEILLLLHSSYPTAYELYCERVCKQTQTHTVSETGKMQRLMSCFHLKESPLRNDRKMSVPSGNVEVQEVAESCE